jgi:putative phosphoesterase
MTSIGLLSDTHSYLPESVFHHFKEVDEIWHAGDIGNIEVADALEKFKPLRAICGNIDGHELRVRYPEHLIFEVENVKILMMHIGGYPPKYNAESKLFIQQHKPDIFICGHSHILKVMPDTLNNLLHINPGACGKLGWHKVSTLIRFEITVGKIHKLEVIELSKM